MIGIDCLPGLAVGCSFQVKQLPAAALENCRTKDAKLTQRRRRLCVRRFRKRARKADRHAEENEQVT
jgi:hypothetical protein